MDYRELFRKLEDPNTDHYLRLRCFWTAYYAPAARRENTSRPFEHTYEHTYEHTKRSVLFDIMKRFIPDILQGAYTEVVKTAFYNFAVQMFNEETNAQNARILAQFSKWGASYQQDALQRIDRVCKSRNGGNEFENILFDLRCCRY